MRERSIVFSAAMVKAIHHGWKTQTRRVVKGAALDALSQFPPACAAHSASALSPYGQPGDRLWVKEAWRAPASLNDMSPSQIADACLDTGYCKPWTPVEYLADGARNNERWWKTWGSQPADRQPGRYRHARFMPRWASRLMLDITAVRIERLQDISIDDCYAEGIDPHTPHEQAAQAYEHIWNETTGDWIANPWVWVIAFKPVTR